MGNKQVKSGDQRKLEIRINNREHFRLNHDETFEVAKYLEICDIFSLSLSCKLLYNYLWLDQDLLWKTIALRDEFPILEKTGKECKMIYYNLKCKEIKLMKRSDFINVPENAYPAKALIKFQAEFGNLELNQLIYILRNQNYNMKIKEYFLKSMKRYNKQQNHKKLLKLLKFMCLSEDGRVMELNYEKKTVLLLTLICTFVVESEIPGSEEVILKYGPFGKGYEAKLSRYVFSFEQYIISKLLEKCKKKEIKLKQYLKIFKILFENQSYLNLIKENFLEFLNGFLTIDAELTSPILIALLKNPDSYFSKTTFSNLHVCSVQIMEEMSFTDFIHVTPLEIMQYFVSNFEETYFSNEELELGLKYFFQTWNRYGKMIPREMLQKVSKLDIKRTVYQILECDYKSIMDEDSTTFLIYGENEVFKMLKEYGKTVDSSEYEQFFPKLQELLEYFYQNRKDDRILKFLKSVIQWIAPRYPLISSLQEVSK